ncbi:M13 family metallopeptidase [Xanthomonadaceae bacterium JHOS43]|nr:M13 family metallopeptidase [Xanthomonadaceae bacterium JHOS43]
MRLPFRLAPLLLIGLSAPLLAQLPDPRHFDTKTPACADFYQHANGGWLQANPVPTGFASWGTFEEVGLHGLLQQRSMLEAAAGSEEPGLRLIGDLYASGMNEAAVEAAGSAPLKPLMDRIARIQKARDVAPGIADLHARGIPVLFDFGANDDLKNPARRIAYANQGGLGLSDRDYYLRDDADTRLLLTAYQGYIERLLTLSGSANPAAEADAVVKIEKRLAQVSLSLLQLRDPTASYRVVTVKDLEKSYPAVQWRKFLKAQGIGNDVSSISVAHTDFFRQANELIRTLPPEQWRAYLRFHVAHALAPYLTSGYVQAHDAMYLRTLRGSQEPMPRWRRVLGTVDTLLGSVLGHHYLKVHFPPASRDAAEGLVTQIRATLREKLENAPWLGAQARLAALEKIDAVDIKLGGPDQVPVHDGVKLTSNNYAGNVLALVGWMHRRQMAGIGKVREEWQWPQPAHAVNVYYDPARNQLVLPAGLMQPPIFDPAGDTAVNYGALGSIVAHELMRGFDAIGSRFDAQGRIAPWWQEADTNAFTRRFQPLVAQYDAYPVLGQIKIRGHLTLGENIADLAGVEVAHAAFGALGPQPDVANLTANQRYFLSYANLWRRNYRDEELQLRSQIDVHAPAKWRVNGPLSNLTPFADAFKCKVGSGSMMRPEAKRVTVFGS